MTMPNDFQVTIDGVTLKFSMVRYSQDDSFLRLDVDDGQVQRRVVISREQLSLWKEWLDVIAR